MRAWEYCKHNAAFEQSPLLISDVVNLRIELNIHLNKDLKQKLAALLLTTECDSFWEELHYGMVSMASACLLHPASLRRTSQWGSRIWAILSLGPNTKQSHKPSVDLATNGCDTSLRSSRVGASLNPESPPQASFQPAACSPRERRTPSSTPRSTERKKPGGEGWRAEAFPWQTVNPGECSRQEPQTTTICEVQAQRTLSCGGTENTREQCCSHLKEEAESSTKSWEWLGSHIREEFVFYRLIDVSCEFSQNV